MSNKKYGKWLSEWLLLLQELFINKCHGSIYLRAIIMGGVSVSCNLNGFAVSFQSVWDKVLTNISKWQDIWVSYMMRLLQAKTKYTKIFTVYKQMFIYFTWIITIIKVNKHIGTKKVKLSYLQKSKIRISVKSIKTQ